MCKCQCWPCLAGLVRSLARTTHDICSLHLDSKNNKRRNNRDRAKRLRFCSVLSASRSLEFMVTHHGQFRKFVNYPSIRLLTKIVVKGLFSLGHVESEMNLTICTIYSFQIPYSMHPSQFWRKFPELRSTDKNQDWLRRGVSDTHALWRLGLRCCTWPLLPSDRCHSHNKN